MQINKWNFNPFFAADTDTPGGELSAQDVVDILSDDTDDSSDTPADDLLADDKEEKKEAEKEDKEDTDEKEEDSEELELDEDTEEDEDEDIDYVPHVSKKEILKKYPTLFKEYPSLERAYYKATQYEELFPTMQDAKEVAEKAQNFDSFQSTLLNGKMEPVLKAVKDSDPKAFNKIVDSYLDNLRDADQGAFNHVVSNMGKNVIIAMVREADSSKNENLKAAAVVLNQFLFGNSEFVPPGNFGKKADNPEVDEEKKKLQDERQQFLQERFDTAVTEMSSKCNNIIRGTIANHIDPKGVMSDYVKNTAIRDCMEKLDKLISQDERFVRVKDQLWRKAVESNFSKSSTDAVRTLFLNKNKTLLKDVISQARNAALKGIGKRVMENREEPSRRGRINPGQSTQSNSSKGSSKDIPSKMSTLEFLSKD